MTILKNILLWGVILPLVLVIVIIDFAGLPTFLIFLILKLTGKITWEWFIVCLPAIMSIVSWLLTKLIRAVAAAVRGL